MNEDRIIRLREVMEKTGLSRSSVYRLAADKNSDFPKHLRISPRCLGWRKSAIDKWIDSRQEKTA